MRQSDDSESSDEGRHGADGSDVPVRVANLSDEVLETSRLVLELIHAGYALEGPARAGLSTSPTTHAAGARVSRQAIRASIELYQRGELTMGAIASALQMSPGWATRVVDELVAAGYAVRTVDPRDRRVVRVSLSQSAAYEAATAYRWRADLIDEALGAMGPDARSAVRTFLSRLVERLARGQSV